MVKLSLKTIFKSKSEFFVTLCVIVYVISQILLITVGYSSDIFNPSESEKLQVWLLRIIRNISILCVVFTLIVFGIRKLRLEGFSKRRIVEPVLGIILCLVHIFLCYTGNLMFGSLCKSFQIDEKHLERMEQKLSSQRSDLDNDTYSLLSKLVAEENFFKDGITVEYTTPDGRVVMYEPNEETKALYQQKKQAQSFFSNTQKVFYSSLYIWIAITLISIILGLTTPVKK